MKMIKQPTIPPMPKRPTFDARDTQYNLPIDTDLISRAEAIDALSTITMYKGGIPFDTAVMRIKQLPPIQPKRGKWIKLDMHRGMADHKCTACEQECYVPTCMGEPMYAFCPNCGADMRGEQDE